MAGRMKHINIRFQFVREKITEGTIKLDFASLEDLIDSQWFLDPPDTVSMSDMPVDTHSDLTPRKMLLERIVEKLWKELYINSEIHRQSFF